MARRPAPRETVSLSAIRFVFKHTNRLFDSLTCAEVSQPVLTCVFCHSFSRGEFAPFGLRHPRTEHVQLEGSSFCHWPLVPRAIKFWVLTSRSQTAAPLYSTDWLLQRNPPPTTKSREFDRKSQTEQEKFVAVLHVLFCFVFTCLCHL